MYSNKVSKQGVIEHKFFEAIFLKLIFEYYYNTLAAGLHQVMQPEMGVILRVTESEILMFSFGVAL